MVHLTALEEVLPQLLHVPLLVVAYLTRIIPSVCLLMLEVGEVEVDGCEVFLVAESLEEVLHVLFLVSPEVEERSSVEERSTSSTGSEW